MKNKKLIKKTLVITLAVIISGGIITVVVYHYNNSKQLNIPIKNQQENQVQTENKNELENLENAAEKQENIESGNQDGATVENQQTVPEGWQNYSYNDGIYSLSFNYPLNPEYSYSKRMPAIQEEWTVNEFSKQVEIKGSKNGAGQYRFMFSQEQNAQEWVINTLESAAESLKHTYEQISLSNGLTGYKSVFDNGEAHRYVYYFVKGDKILTVYDYFNNWFDPTQSILDIDSTLLNSINFN